MAEPAALAPVVLAAYRTAFLQDVMEGHRRQIVMPQVLIPLLLPAIWIAIPHNNRAWLYQSRWLVVAVVFAISYEQLMRASSTNAAWSVISGLMATHGSMMCMHHLIFTNPQRDAARALRIRKNQVVTRTYTSASPLKSSAYTSNGNASVNGSSSRSRHKIKALEGAAIKSHRINNQVESGDDYYVWQRFPSEAPFWQRLWWAFDLLFSFRGAGWSTSISAIPRPYISGPVKDGQIINMASIPSRTPGGYEYLPPSEFLWNRLRQCTLAYLALDFLGTFMMKDPYFVVGPSRAAGYPLPWYLLNLRPWQLEAYRQLFSISGAFFAVLAGTCVVDMAHYFVGSRLFPSRVVPWMYASAFGSLDQVCGRGLAGFWGSWWHQTFRQSFLSPAKFLIKHRLMRKGTRTGNMVALLSTFAMSGLLHGSGSLTAMPGTRLWRQPAFFILQAAGILLQQALASSLRLLFPRLPAPLRRTGNAAFTLLWLFATAALFNDDMADMGLWLLEPVPVSVFRALGLGLPGDAIWRWDSYYFCWWYAGRHWWESGLAV